LREIELVKIVAEETKRDVLVPEVKRCSKKKLHAKRCMLINFHLSSNYCSNLIK
jgi:hypothetical protein